MPAREGTLRVLRAARDVNVKRVVLTSSCGAIYYGHPPTKTPFDETSWTIFKDDLTAYVKSKAIAERTTWDFIAQEGRGLELSAIDPAGIFGPIQGQISPLHRTDQAPHERHAGMSRLYFGVVDVRDVADLHLWP